MKHFLQKYINLNVCLALVVFVTVAISAQQLIIKRADNSNFSFYNNYLIFKHSFYHLAGNKDLYEAYGKEYWDYFKYSPAFALFFSVFAVLPDWLGLTLWNLLNSLVFFFALWRFPFPDYKKKILAFAFTFIELTTAAHNSQSNGLITGLLLFSFLLFEKKSFFIGTLFIALSVYIKLFGVIAFMLILLYPERWRASLYVVFWMVLLAVIPLVVVSYHQLSFLYQSWFQLLKNDREVTDGFSVMGLLSSWFHLKADKIWVPLTGLVMLCIPLLRFRIYKELYFRILMLASVMIWVVIFNHRAESPTFIIAVTGIVLWFFGKAKNSTIDLVLLLFAFLLTELSPTDIFPRYFRENYIIPYSLKVLPCILVWIKILYDQVSLNENDNLTEQV